MFPFKYQSVGQDLIKELHDQIFNRNESIVLLGPRYGGKRYVMDRLRGLLEKSGIEPIVQLRFLTETPINTSEQARNLMREAIPNARPHSADGPDKQTDDPFAPLTWLVEESSKPVMLFAANVDGMSHHLAQQFLRNVRTLVDTKSLVAIMSGENTFRDLVHGKNSEFTCAGYVLQGYTLEEFQDFLKRCLNYLRLEFTAPGEAACHLWEITGGNLYILRVILWSIIQQCERQSNPSQQPIEIDEIPSTIKMLGIPGAFGAHIFRHATQLIARDPDCWKKLELLLANLPVRVPPHDAPERLELAGIARREISDGDATLRFSSPMMAAFVERYYDARRFGDLYASVRDWDEAFKRYQRLHREKRVRPSGTDDRAEVEAVVGVLCSSLYSKVVSHENYESRNSPIDAVKTLLAQGCCYVLGFGEITFWHRDTLLKSPEWRNDSFDIGDISEDVLDQIRRILPTTLEIDTLPRILKPKNKALGRYSIAALLPARLHKQAIVVVSDFGSHIVMSQERLELVSQVLKDFIGAYGHAVDVDNLQSRQLTQRRHEQIVSSVFASLGTPGFNVHTLLEQVAKELRDPTYKRVLFCLVDREANRIVGELDCSDDGVDVAKMTDWPLTNVADDLQPYVINTKKEIIVTDARKEPLARKHVVNATNMRALAIIPILNPAHEAIGTIHIERADGAVPKRDEVDDVKFFGRLLAIAIEQCARLNLMEDALDKVPEPLMIVDRYRQLRYRNHAASEFFGGQTGWRNRSYLNLPFPDIDQLPHAIAAPIIESLDTGNRRVTYIEGLEQDPKYLGQVITDVIRDWRNRKVGGILRIQDRTSLHQYFEAPHLPAEAPDAPSAIRKILEATTLLGHKWGRLYLVRKGSDGKTDEFVSRLSYGDDLPPGIEEEFNTGKIVLTPRSVKGHRDWLCIEKREPIVFCWNDNLPDGAEDITRHGLKVINWREPNQHPQIKKKAGDFWMDFPLIDSNEVLGKVCLQLDEDLRLEDFALLRQLSIKFSSILANKLKLDRKFDAWELLIKKSVAEQTMETFLHNLSTHLASLFVIFSRYRKKEKVHREIKELNDQLEDIVDFVDATFDRASDLLKPVSARNLRKQRLDIGALIERTLYVNLPPGTWVFLRDGELPAISLDPQRFETALLEMIRNSELAIPSVEERKIEIIASPTWPAGPNGIPGINITYRDNGPGVPEEYRVRIFDDFFSFRPGEDTPGTGLGLSFVKRVIEAHGGAIAYSAYTSGHAGAEFTIGLPLSEDSAPTEVK